MLGAGLVLVTLAVAGTATLGLRFGGHDDATPRRATPAATATVTRQTLTRTVTLAGDLGYGPVSPLTSTATGTVTWLPEIGSTVRRGQPLFRADEQPVLLLYGFLPMYRPLSVGTRGSDVRQFERNLAALGYRGFTVDEEFTAGTATAVRHWQEDLGLPETGTVERARVSYAPGPVRIAQRLVAVGATATGDLLSYTGTTRMVTVAAGVGEVGWATRGTRVTVNLPTSASVTGQVTTVGPPTSATGGAAADPERPGTSSAVVEVTVAIADQKALGGLAGALVDVRYVAQERRDVLTVPVDALIALAEGGYGLEAIGPDGSRIVPVQVGLFAVGRVEVSGAGLTEGLTVGVPG